MDEMSAVIDSLYYIVNHRDFRKIYEPNVFSQLTIEKWQIEFVIIGLMLLKEALDKEVKK